MLKNTDQLEFKNIRKSFGKRLILHDVSITLRAAECYLLTGKNGAGKTTLQRICAGLEKSDTCTLHICTGLRVLRRQRQYLQANCMYLHQQPFMFDTTVTKNLAYALPRKTPRPERNSRIDMALDWAGLQDIADAQAKTLSGGERQRVAMARAWLRAPRYLFLDEPTNNLDGEARQRTIALITSLKTQGVGLLITSHETEQFSTIADRCYLLDNAKLTEKNLTSRSDNRLFTLVSSQQVAQ